MLIVDCRCLAWVENKEHWRTVHLFPELCMLRLPYGHHTCSLCRIIDNCAVRVAAVISYSSVPSLFQVFYRVCFKFSSLQWFVRIYHVSTMPNALRKASGKVAPHNMEPVLLFMLTRSQKVVCFQLDMYSLDLLSRAGHRAKNVPQTVVVGSLLKQKQSVVHWAEKPLSDVCSSGQQRKLDAASAYVLKG